MKLAFSSFFRSYLLRGATTAAITAILLSLASLAAAQAPKTTLTITPTAVTKTYDGVVDENPVFAYTATGYTSGDSATDVFKESPLERSAGDDAGVYTFTLKPAADVLTTAALAKYDLELVANPGAFTITKKEVTYTTTAAHKIYDSTTLGPVNFGGGFATGDIVAGDHVYPGGGDYSQEGIGTNLTITGVDLAGNNGGNYMLSTGSSFSGNITVRTTAYISTAADKLWDDETFPPGVYLSRGLAASGSAPHAMSPYAVYGGDFEPGSRIEGDDLCIVGGAFTQKEVGNDIQITGFQLGSPVSTVFMAGTPTEQTEDICTPGSGLSQNYELSPDSSIRGDITRRQIRLADVSITKAYDGTTASTETFPTVTGDPVIGLPGDGIAIRNLGYNSRFANVGNKHGSLFGKPATGLLPCPENPAVCDDDDKPAFRVIVELAPGANADHTKFYDLGKLVGTVGMETFESIDERVFETTTGTEVRIIPKEVTLSNVQLTKVYDGDTSIAGAEITATIGGAAAGEMLTLRIKDGADATFAAATADSGITISGFGADDLELVSGNALTRSFNYSLPASITATGVITQRPLCITFNGAGMLPPTGAGLRDIDLMSILTTDVCKGLFSGHALGTTATTIQFTGEVNVETQVGDISVLSAGNLALATGAPNDNYMLDFRGGQWYYTSSSKSNVLVLTPTNNLIRVYGEPLTDIAFSVAPQAGSDFMTGDTAASTFFTTSPITVTGSGIGEHAFSFVASPAYADGIDTKYDFVIDPVMRHTITKRPLHIAAGGFQFFPGGLAQAQAATLKFTVGTDPMQGYAPEEGQAEALSGALALSSDTDAAGNYAILIGTLAATANYAIASFTSRAAFVVEPPEAPRITAVLQSSQNGQPALVVRWEPGAGGVPVESWDVNYKLATELSYPSNPRIPTLPSTTRSAVLTGLNINPNALYNVIVIAESLTGAKSAPSAEVNQTTHAIPPAPVIDMSAPARVSAGKAANTISWTYGGSGVDAAMEYYLTVVKDKPLTTTVFPSIDTLADSLPMGVEFIRNAAGDGGTLRGLEADERYHARLRILAKSGVLSAVSNIPIFNSAQAPGRPGNFNVNPGSPSVSVRNRELALSWLPPSNPGPTGARIVGYDVRWRVAAQVEENWVPNNDGTRVPGGGSARQFNIADLTQGAQYIAQVRAASQIGSSGWREGTGTPVATSQTDATLSSLEVLNADSTATFTLMPPFTLGVNNYNLAVARDTTSVVIKAKAAQSLARFNLSTSTTPVFTARIPDEGVVVSLVNTAMIMGTTMVVNVTAPNGKDKVVYRVIVTFQTDPPSEPTNLRLSVGDLAGELKVDWALPESLNGGPVLSYTVRWKLTTDTNYAAADVQTRVVSTPPEAADRTATITGLTGGMTYDVQVLATNIGGDGAYADAVQGTPPLPSGVSTLSSLTVLNDQNAAVALDRIFSPAITTYTANVPNGVAAITLTPTTTHAGATVSVTDGTTPQSLASKAKSNPFPLTVGSNTLTTTVTAEDASTTAYVLTVTRLFPLPDAPAAPTLNAIRDALEVAWVAPADNGSPILNYRVRWRTSATDPDGTPNNGDETAAGAWQNASGPDDDGQQVGVSPLAYTILNLTNGTDYDVQVAAVTASGAGDFSPAATAAPQANDATLSNLAVIGSDSNAITLSSSFAAQTETYTASVGSDIASVTLTATPTAAVVDSITLTRDSAPSQTLTAATASNPQRLNYGATTLVLVVTAADGRTTMTYTLIFTRDTGRPLPPTGLTVTDAIESLVVEWVAPVNNGGLPITDYSLRWAQSPAATPSWLNAGGKNGQLLGSAAVTYTIPNLKISQEYLVQVAAENGNGLSTWSPAVTGTAVAAANDADLRSLTVVDSAGGVVGLVETFDRAITAYTASVANEIDSVRLTATYAGSSLTISGSNSPDSGTQSDPVGLNIGANPIPMVVSSSDSSVMKTYTLTVTRAAGLPDKIDPPVAKPTGPREKRITVTWVWDGSGNNGSPHLGFDVQVRLTAEPGDPDNTWMPDADGVNLRIATAREHIFENLEPAGGSFQTRVRVVNGIGDGAWSEIVDSRASGPPDAPTLRTVTGVAGALDIAWTHAAFTGGDGVNLSSQHDVRWRTSATDPDGAANSGDETVAGAWQDGTGDDDDGKRITPSQLSHTITGLSGGMEYDVQVRVYNEFPVNTNLSDWSAIQKGTPIRHEVVITPAAATKVYGAADPDVDYTASFLGDDTKSSVFGTDVPFARVVGETVNDYGYVRKSTLPFQDARFAGKYTITVATTNKFTITTKEVTYASTAADKVYDGNTAAPANLGGSFRGIIVDTVNGVSIDDSARLSVSGGAFADKVVETNKAVTGFTLGGDAAGNYMLNTGGSSVTGDITALATTLTATAAERVYNADTAVGSVATTFSPPILTGDTVTVDTSAAVYADANIGAAKTINGLSTGGADVGNYAITIEGTGTVTKRPLRVAAGGSGAGTESAGDFVVPTALLSDRSLLTIVGGVTNEGLAGSDTAAQVLTGEIAAGARTGGAATGGGTAPLTIGNLAVDTNPPGSNYELFFTAGVFSFTDSGKQTLVLTPVLTTTRVYGEPDPSSYLFSVAEQSGSRFLGADTADTTFFGATSPVTRTAGDDVNAYPFSVVASPDYAAGVEAKYIFVIAQGAQYTITAKELTIAAVTLTKVYNGDDAVTGATVSGGALTGVVGSESFTLGLIDGSDGEYAKADVGTALTVNNVDSADLELTGDDAASKPANYTLADPASVTGAITAKEVTVAAATLTKSYDGGTDFGSSSIKTGTGAVTGVVQGEALTLTASAGDYASADVGAGLTVSGATLGLSATTPTKSTNYMLPSPVTLNGEITPKEVTVAAVTVTKPYDNTDSTSGAVIGGGAVSAAIGTQSFQLQLASDNDGVYVSTDAGDDINITGADFELSGADADSKPENYMLPALDLTGVIAPKVVSVADVVVEKPYDGETGAAVAVATVDGGAVTGTIAPQTFDLALASGHNITYASSAASGTVVLNDQDSADFRLVSTGDGGGVPANYALPAITASGRIVPRVVDVAKVTLTKEYDRTNLADSATVSGGAITNTVQSDSLTLASGGGKYSDVDVDNNLVVSDVNFSLRDSDGKLPTNYALPAQLDVVGVITPREVSVSGGTPSLFKDYDSLTVLGNTRVVEGITLGKLLGDDSLVLAVTAGVYADKKVDTGITVTGLEWELRKSKPDAQGDPANYKLPLDITGLASISTAEIRPKPITITAGDGSAGKPSKIYDGTDTMPTGLGEAQAAAGQVFQGDDVGFIAASVYNSKNVLEATGITITLSGSDANNYVVIGGGIAAEITPKEVAVSGITLNGTASKVYDATTAAPSGFSISGSLTAADVIEADRGKVTFGGAGVYNSKNVSDAATITIVFAGEEAGNYIASQPTTPATITKRPLIVTANTVSGLAADQPDAAELVYTVEKGVSGEGLAGSDRTTDVLSGALAYGTANTDGSVPIEIGSLVVVGGNYEIDFTTGVFIPSSMLDVDASQTVDGTDGIIISRYLLGLRGDALTAGLPRVSGAQGSSGMIATRVEKLRIEGTLDVDGNSVTNAADGILIARYLLGVVSGSGLTDGQTSAGAEEGVKTKIKGLLPPAAE